MTGARLRAGFVGAGDVCPVHIEAVQALEGVDIVGIYDLNTERAERLGATYGVAAYQSLEELVAAGANVLHVLTPPGTHAAVACAAMELGCDVLIEKPLAEDLEDCEAVIDTAERTGQVATVDHLLLFDPGIQKASAAVAAGKLGKVVGIDILRGGELIPYEGGPLPPHLRDPGHTFRDLAVHHFYLFQKFLGPIEDVRADWMSLGGEPAIAWDEWRALVRCRDGLGNFQISFNAKPIQNQMFVHGTRGILRVDLFSLIQSQRSFYPLPSPIERLVNLGVESVLPLLQTPSVICKVTTKRIQRLQGIRSHVAEFYQNLESGEPQNVSLTDAMELVKWNEAVAREATAEYEDRVTPFRRRAPSVDVLVTGASGAFGGAILNRLRRKGLHVRAMVRRIPDAPINGIEYAVGNLGDPAFVDGAVKGATTVIHCGAVVKGTEADHRAGTVVGTQNIVDSAVRHNVQQVIHVSSMSVIDNASLDGRLVNEDAPTEGRAEERGQYTRAKLEAERIVSTAVTDGGLPAVILRPGAIIGGGVALAGLGGAMGGGSSRFIVLGDGEVTVPLVYLDDAVDAVIAAMERQLVGGDIIHIFDQQQWSQNRILETLDPSKKLTRVPRPIVFLLAKASDLVFARMDRQSPLSEYRMRSGLSKMRFESDRAERVLGWTPAVGVAEGIRRYAALLHS